MLAEVEQAEDGAVGGMGRLFKEGLRFQQGRFRPFNARSVKLGILD